MLDTHNGGDGPSVPQGLENNTPHDNARTAAVYRHIDADGRTLYIGCSVDPLSRTAWHISASSWARQIDMIKIEWFATRKEAFAHEARLLREERPPFNNIERVKRDRFPKPERLAQYLKDKGMSQAQGALWFGVSHSYINALLTGERAPSGKVAVHIQERTDGAVPVSSWPNLSPVIAAAGAA